jgi:hypothetical protein
MSEPIIRECESCGIQFSVKYPSSLRRYCTRVCGQTFPVEQRFWRMVNKGAPGGCWEWLGAIGSGGYGNIGTRVFNGKVNTLAHRLSWLLHRGEDAGRYCVCHRCDNRKCVNPEHLFLGTRDDNNKDRESKGRGRTAKFSESDVLAIRAAGAGGESGLSIARRYGAGHSNICKILRGGSWTRLL